MPEKTNDRRETVDIIAARYRRAIERRAPWEATWRFSCWNKTDPNRRKLLAVTPENKAFRSCLRIVRKTVNGGLDDPTSGATHYHTKTVSPPWSRGRKPSTEIGHHRFYNDIE